MNKGDLITHVHWGRDFSFRRLEPGLTSALQAAGWAGVDIDLTFFGGCEYRVMVTRHIGQPKDIG